MAFFSQWITFTSLNMPKYLREAASICQYSNKCSIDALINNSRLNIKA